MPVRPVPAEQMAAVQADMMEAALRAAPPPANVGVATTLHDAGAVTFRGRRYRVPRLPWRECAQLQALEVERRQLALAERTLPNLRQAIAVVEEMVRLLAVLIRRPWWQRLLRRNPFRAVELSELDELVAFFSSARTRSRVFLRASIRAADWLQPTWQTGSPSLRVGIRAGWRGGNRVVGGTTSLASRASGTRRFGPAAHPANSSPMRSAR